MAHRSVVTPFLGPIVIALLLITPLHATSFTVGVVSSDDAALPMPASRTGELTPDQVEQMVRRALDLIGGMSSVVADTAGLVAIKPNVVQDRPSGSGVVTDARVVRAVALLVHEAAPRARILIAEGAGGWISPAYQDCLETHRRPVVDGFEVAGHRATVVELQRRGVDIDCFDLNFDRALSLEPPTGGLSMPEYELAATIFDADVWINCPVAKTHGSKITCCLKNQFGIFPGIVYGWQKSDGTPTHRGIPHAPRMMDETFIDLLSLTQPDLNVVDMIAGSEGGAFQGEPKRANLVVAGRNAVATDLVCASLMGFNPDDFEFAVLAGLHGVGPASIDQVDVLGGSISELASRYRKASMDYTSEWAEHAGFGMGPRRWVLLGPLPPDHAFGPEELVGLEPLPGEQGWSSVVRFGDDRIDLDRYYDDPVNCSVYAFTHFTMSRADSVRLWVGSDEGMEVWLDGQPVYRHHGRRRHRLGDDRVPHFIEAGEHRLLVRASQTRGRFDFSLNICEPVDDPLYAGNRYPGLRFDPGALDRPDSPGIAVAAEDIRDDWFTPLFESTLAGVPDPVGVARTAPGTVSVAAPSPTPGPGLFEVAVHVAGMESSLLDSITLAIMGEAPFHLGFRDLGGWYPPYAPPPGRMLSWLGLLCDIRTGERRRESLKAVRGWLALGRVPILGWGERNWFAVSGSRQSPETTELHAVSADTSGWFPFTDDWWAPFAGYNWQNCPVIVVEWSGVEPARADLTDSLAALAIDLGRQRWTLDGPMPWGERRFPAGLAAWDTWVIRWEKLPLTLTWLESDGEARSSLAHLNSWSEGQLVEARALAAAYFGQAAAELAGDRRAPYLRSAAQAYADVAAAFDALRQVLPTEGNGPWSDEEQQRVRGLVDQRHAWRRAREAERRALTSLSEMLGHPALPPAREDPLARRDGGTRLLTWKADLSRGVHDLTLRGADLASEQLFGIPPEGQVSEVLAAVPRDDGREVIIETLSGEGLYQVLQQPAASNGWTTLVRIDDAGTSQNATELIVWSIATR